MAILFRQQYVINFLGWLATRPPVTWPLRLRWALAKYYHFGGLHVGAALAGTAWYLAFVGLLISGFASGKGDVAVASVVVSAVVLFLLVVILVMARPRFRAARHNNFEATHRFCGWAVLALVWLNTVLFVTSRARGPVGLALLSAPTVWLLLLTTAASCGRGYCCAECPSRSSGLPPTSRSCTSITIRSLPLAPRGRSAAGPCSDGIISQTSRCPPARGTAGTV